MCFFEAVNTITSIQLRSILDRSRSVRFEKVFTVTLASIDLSSHSRVHIQIAFDVDRSNSLKADFHSGFFVVKCRASFVF